MDDKRCFCLHPLPSSSIGITKGGGSCYCSCPNDFRGDRFSVTTGLGSRGGPAGGKHSRFQGFYHRFYTIAGCANECLEASGSGGYVGDMEPGQVSRIVSGSFPSSFPCFFTIVAIYSLCPFAAGHLVHSTTMVPPLCIHRLWPDSFPDPLRLGQSHRLRKGQPR